MYYGSLKQQVLKYQLHPQLHYWDSAYFTLMFQILNLSQWNLEPQMAEQFANERKRLSSDHSSMQSAGAAQTAKKAENHSKECPINTTGGKSWVLW